VKLSVVSGYVESKKLERVIDDGSDVGKEKTLVVSLAVEQ
jgi:hypothetical protein